jgi:hypothetical protein
MGPQSKQRTWLWAVLAIFVVAAGLYYWNTDDMQDRRVWGRLQAELTEANVIGAALETASGKRFTLSDPDRAELLTLLRKADYDGSNRVGHGPTVQAFLRLTFADGKELTVGIWGPERYELSPRWLDPGAQFLIRHPDLGVWLMQRFQGPAIG